MVGLWEARRLRSWKAIRLGSSDDWRLIADRLKP
jgi:hypothetical protein